MSECTVICNTLKEHSKLSEAERIKKRDEARQLAIDADRKRKLAAQQPWTKDELAFLIKATKKFPGGAVKRWEQIADMVNKLSNSGIIRAASECIKKQIAYHLWRRLLTRQFSLLSGGKSKCCEGLKLD